MNFFELAPMLIKAYTHLVIKVVIFCKIQASLRGKELRQNEPCRIYSMTRLYGGRGAKQFFIIANLS